MEDRPTPKIQLPTDAILKVSSTALCVSIYSFLFFPVSSRCPRRLNFCRGLTYTFTVVTSNPQQVLSASTNLSARLWSWERTSRILSLVTELLLIFFTACQECFDCVRGQASRCIKGELFGNSTPANIIDGGQSEYVRVPLASTALVKTPTGELQPTPGSS